MGWTLLDESSTGRERRWSSGCLWSAFKHKPIPGIVEWSLDGSTLRGRVTSVTPVFSEWFREPLSAIIIDCGPNQVWLCMAQLTCEEASTGVHVLAEIESVCADIARSWVQEDELKCAQSAVPLESMSWIDRDYFVLSRFKTVPEENGRSVEASPKATRVEPPPVPTVVPHVAHPGNKSVTIILLLLFLILWSRLATQ